MRKSFKKRSTQILKVFVLLPFLAQTFVTPLFALDELIPEIQVDIPIDVSEDILDEGISDPTWITDGDTAITNNVVVLGEVYTAPQNEGVSLTFTKLPEESGYLTVKEITLTDEEIEATNAVSSTAYDITTDMVDGTYEYDLTLPTTSDDVSVVYAESRDDILSNTTEVNENLTIENGKVEIEGLEHFTVFVVVGGNDLTGDCSGVTLISTTSGDICYETIKAAVDNANDGDTIMVASGTYVLTSVIDFDTPNVSLIGIGEPIIQVSGTGERFMITASGNTIEGFKIEKTDKTGVQNIIYIGANNTIIRNNEIFGQFVIGDSEVSRAMVFTGGLSGLQITSNTIYDLRQPGYISGVTTGIISNNHVYRTKGWVVEQGDMTFSNNTWGTGADSNVYDIAILATTSSSYYTNILSMSELNNDAFIEDQRTSPSTLSIVYVNGSVTTSGDGTARSPKKTISEGVIRVTEGGDIYVAEGTYNEYVLINKNLKLYGEQANVDPRPSHGGRSGSETVVDGNGSQIFDIDANNVEINGFEFVDGGGYMIEQINSHSDYIFQYNIVHDQIGNDAIKVRVCTDCLVSNNYIYDIAGGGDGIGLSGGTNTAIRDNELVNQQSENAAIYVYSSTNTSITGNIVTATTDNDGIKLGNKGGDDALGTGGEIRNNIVSNTAQDGISVYMSNVVVDGNDISGSSSINGALYLAFGISNVSITNNKIHDNTSANGIKIGSPVNASTVIINNNEIYNNTNYGLYNFSNTLLDAKLNWWGDNTGPHDEWDDDSSTLLTNILGSGNSVRGTVDYSSWLTMDTTPPSVPVLESPIDGAYINDNTPLMQWANSSDDDSGVKGYYYRVYRNCTDINDSSTCSGVFPGLTGLWRTNSEYQAGTTSDGTYYWQVMAEDNAGNQSAWSDLEQVVIDTKSPDAPVITSPIAESYFTSTPISNQWTEVTDSSGIAFYRIEYVYDDLHTFSGGPYRTTSSTSRNHTPNIGEQGGVTISVQAVDNAGNESGWSDPIHYTYDETNPTVPTNLSFETTGGDVLGCGIFTNEYTIVATWDASDDDDSGIAYYEYMSFNPTTGWIWGPKNIGNVTERQGSFTVGEGTYGFAVRAIDLAGNTSDWTSLDLTNSCQITYDITPPSAPTGLHILDHEVNDLSCGGYTNNRNITIDWNDNPESDFDHYILDLKDKDNHKQLGVSEYDATIRDTDDLYKYKIRAVDKAGNISPESNWCEVTLDRVVPTGTIDSVKMIKGTNTYHITEWSVNDNTPTIEGTVNDNNGISSVKVTINGFTTLANNVAGNWEADISSVIPDGTYTISAEFEDVAGNITIVNQDITIDTVAPTAIYTHYLNGTLITDSIAYVKGVSELSFKGTINDTTPSSGILKDSFVIFEAQDNESFRFSANGKRAFCNWRSTPNLLTFSGTNNTETIDTEVQFSNCTGVLDDGEYYMAHQVYDSAVRQDIPSIHQFRDVLGLHFIVDSVAPTSNINIQADLNETKDLTHNNGWHGEGWYYNFDNIILSVDTPNYGDFIQYQIVDGDIPTPGAIWTEAVDGIDLAATINAKADGIYTLFWYAEDLAGNTDTEQREVLKLDRTPSEYTIDYASINGFEHDDIYYIPTDTITVDIDVEDTHSGYTRARYDLYTADENWNCTLDSYNQDNLVPAENITTRTLEVNGLTDGNYCLRIWVYDDVQNKAWTDTNGEQWVHFVIDTINPDKPINLKRRALDGTVFACGDYAKLQTLIPEWDDSTDINFDHYEYASFNAPNGSIGLNEKVLYYSEFVHSWIPTVEGTFGYSVRAVDKAGNKSDWALTGKTLADSCQITYDSTAPVIESLTQYTYNLSEGDTIPDVQTEVTDETGLNRVYYEITGNLGTFPDDMALFGTSEIVDTTGLIKKYAAAYFPEAIETIDTFYIPEGTYTVTYWVTDLAGNESPKEIVTINISNVVPTVDSFTADVLSITEGDTVNFEAIFSDPAYIEYLSGEKHADDAPWLYSFNPEGTYEPELSTNVPGETLSFTHTYNNEGTYLAEFMVCEDSLTDGEGQCTTKTVEIVVSNNVPTVTITPATSEVTQGTPAVVLSANVTNGNAPYTYLWSGDCTGDTPTTTVSTATVGTFTCKLQVTDEDGDIATSQATVTVGAVEGATDEKTTTSTSTTKSLTYTYGDGTGNGGEEEEENNEEEEKSTEDEEVLGETTCEATYKISGTVFYDKNKDGIHDENEKGVEAVDVNIYDSEDTLVKTVTTDEEGYWEAYLCPGEYTTQVEGAEDQSFVLGDSDTTLDISVEKKTQWWLIVVIGSVVLILLGVLVDKYKKKQENILQ